MGYTKSREILNWFANLFPCRLGFTILTKDILGNFENKQDAYGIYALLILMGKVSHQAHDEWQKGHAKYPLINHDAFVSRKSPSYVPNSQIYI